MEFYLEGELRERFIKLFPINSNARLMKWFGVSFSTIQRFKRKLGLQKNMNVIRRQQARDAKRINEQSGYYDSLRGRPPSQASIQGTKRKRAEGFNPMLACKQQNPRKYKAALRKRAKTRRETLRKEKLRLIYGLPQRTNLRIQINPLSRKAITQKYSMIHTCNYFPDPKHASWLYYDSETRRSLRRETTAIQHGLKIINADEFLTSQASATHVTAIHREARSFF